jgi:PAS domain S-box-containing protein
MSLLLNTVQKALERARLIQENRKYREHLEEEIAQRTRELERANQQLERVNEDLKLVNDELKLVNDELQFVNDELHREVGIRKHAEEECQASARQYRQLIENVADGIAVIQDRKIVFVNDALTIILGFTSDQLIEKDPLSLIRDDYREHFQSMLEQLEQGIFAQAIQVPYATGYHHEVWVEERHGFIRWEGKAAVIMTMRDITQSKLREMAIEEERQQLQRENIALRSHLKDRYKFGDIVGKSPVMQKVYELIGNAAATDANVVLYGESGTGKELVARTIHQLSERKEHAFVPVNCGAVPDTLFENELFGHRKGAFTGAHRDQPGFFDMAHQGTLFLDEVGELSPALQVKLLRALEGGEYTPIGSHSITKADVRIIAATNKNLDELKKKNLIREDFYYRVHVITITVPPLRSRKEDIYLLVEHFWERFGKDKKRLALSGEFMDLLLTYHWPGNVRELQNVLLRYLAGQPLEFGNNLPATRGIEYESLNYHTALESFEKQLIIRVLDRYDWHRTNAAEALGIPRKSLYRKMQKYGLKFPN